jgi:hypothetical protein
MNLTIYSALQDACEETGKTLLPGDAEKWRDYQELTPPERLKWREREGHEEFCRLQRLSFHAFI